MNSLPNETTCPKCGKPVSLHALEGLCPECLMRAGFGTMTDDPHVDSSRAFVPPTPEELSRHFPQLEILELLGRGGMGAVYKARQIHLDRIVALKILPPSVSQPASFAERFVREAKALAKLHHPNIVTLYESGQADGFFFFLMEFVDGMNLRQLLASGTISAQEALAIVPQICDALQFAHDRGIVHRDIKPENILLSKEGKVKIADFGIAKIISGDNEDSPSGGGLTPGSLQTEVGKVIGTPSYMAPEQISHPLTVDNRADIYALGVVFYQMLTGELPIGKFTPPSTKVLIDVRLDEIVLRALEKQPELRYQQASLLKTQVETIVSTPLAPIPPPPFPQSKPTDYSGASKRFFRAMLRWITVAFTVFLLTVLGSLYVTNYVLQKVYTAKAMVQVVTSHQNVTNGIGSHIGVDPFSLEGEVQIILSPEVLLPVINDLDLNKTWAKRVYKNSTGVLPPTEALKYLRNILHVTRVRGTNLIEITAASDVPAETAGIANTVVYQYQFFSNTSEKQRIDHEVVAPLHQQMAEQQKVVVEKKIALEKIKQDLKSKGIDTARVATDHDKSELEVRKKDLLSAQEDYDARKVLLQSVINLPDAQFVSTLKALGRPVDNTSDPTHPPTTEQIAGDRRALRVDAEMAQSRVVLLQKELADLAAYLNAQNPNLVTYSNAQQDFAQQQRILDAYNIRLKEIAVDAPLRQKPVLIISKAEIPEYPSHPNKGVNFLISLIAGCFLGIVIASLVEMALWLIGRKKAAANSDN